MNITKGRVSVSSYVCMLRYIYANRSTDLELNRCGVRVCYGLDVYTPGVTSCVRSRCISGHGKALDADPRVGAHMVSVEGDSRTRGVGKAPRFAPFQIQVPPLSKLVTPIKYTVLVIVPGPLARFRILEALEGGHV